MFKYLKKLVSPSEPTEKEPDSIENVGACITFYVQDGEPKVDITMADYSQESVQDLTTILMGLAGSVFFSPTMEMVKDGLFSEDEHEILLKIYMSLGEMEKIVQKNKSGKEEPCIKPQDII